MTEAAAPPYAWSEQAESLAAAVMARYPQPRSAVMPLLYIAMREDGYLTAPGMRKVAEMTGITPAQVAAVAGFYTMYKRTPVGRYLVSVCTSISCWLLGADDVLRAVEGAAGVPAGETDEEGLVSPEHVECIGACGGAPAVQVNYEFVEGASPQAARSLVEWLRTERPESVNGDDLQARFGGPTGFDWAVPDPARAGGPAPAFGPLGTLAGAPEEGS